VAARARPVSAEPDVRSDRVEQFKVAGNATLSTPDPLAKACMVYLAEVWPKAVPFETLRAEARARLDGAACASCEAAAQVARAGPGPDTAAQDRQVLGAHLLYCYTSSGLVELWLQPPRFTTEVTGQPIASPLARLQAEAGVSVTNLRHEVVRLGEAERHLLRLLDGSRDRAGLHTALMDLLTRGVLVVKESGQPVADPARVGDLVNTIMGNSLAHLAREALLVE
jgi:methyltransferase-like protein